MVAAFIPQLFCKYCRLRPPCRTMLLPETVILPVCFLHHGIQNCSKKYCRHAVRGIRRHFDFQRVRHLLLKCRNKSIERHARMGDAAEEKSQIDTSCNHYPVKNTGEHVKFLQMLTCLSPAVLSVLQSLLFLLSVRASPGYFFHLFSGFALTLRLSLADRFSPYCPAPFPCH